MVDYAYKFYQSRIGGGPMTEMKLFDSELKVMELLWQAMVRIGETV